jgi:8-oxo-dGTP diphosphatase
VDIEILSTLQVVDEILPKYNQHWVATTFIAKIKGNRKPKIMEPHKCDAIGWFPVNKLPKPLSFVTSQNIKAYKALLEKDPRRRLVNYQRN